MLLNYFVITGHNIVDAVEMLVWQINEIEKVEPEKEGKDWPLAELVILKIKNSAY